MKVKDLIKALQACDPETRVDADVERCDNARMYVINKCRSKDSAELLTGLEVDGVHLEMGLQGEDEDTISCILQLKVIDR